MRLGVRAILLIVAIVFFLVALVTEDNPVDWLALGLIFLAGAFLAGEVNLGVGPGRRL